MDIAKLPNEQTKELEVLVDQLDVKDLDLTSGMDAIYSHSWYMFLKLSFAQRRYGNTAEHVKLAGQFRKEQRKFVKMLHGFLKRGPTLQDIIKSWPQFETASVPLKEFIEAELAELDKPIPRRSALEVQIEKFEKLDRQMERLAAQAKKEKK